MVDLRGFTLQDSAFATSTQMGGAMAGALLVLWKLKTLNFRRYVAGALCAMVVGDALVAILRDATLLHGALAIRGVGSGVLFAALMIYIAKHREKERFYGVILGAQFLVAATAIYALPTLFDSVGWSGVFFMISAMGVLFLAASGLFPTSNVESVDPSADKAKKDLHYLLSIPVLSCLAAYLLHYTANASIWTFLERIGVNLQLGNQGTRFGRSLPLLGGIAAIVASAALLRGHLVYWEFVFAAALFNGAFSVSAPYFQGLQAELDPSGRVLTIGSLILYAGWVIGPIFGAGMESLYGFDGMLIVSMLLFSLALLLMAPVSIRLDRAQRRLGRESGK
jgi:predicted MFS family arabinose efflux permease